MPLSRRELIRRLSALSGAGFTGLLPVRALSADLDEFATKPLVRSLAASAPDLPPDVPPDMLADLSAAAPGTGYPNRLPVLTIGEQVFSDTKDPVNSQSSSGATSKFVDQVRGAVDEPGFYTGGSNAPLRWLNLGGDWLDADGIAQGPRPFASFNVPARPKNSEFWIQIDVTALVRSFVRGDLPNWGFFLKVRTSNSNAVPFRSRFAASNPPQLVLATSAGPVTLPCGRSIQLTTSSYGSQAGSPAILLSGGTDVGLVWFDTSALPASTQITSASLRLSTFTTAYAFGANTLDLFRISNPAYAKPMPVQELGIASKYAADQGIANDPDVYWVQQFADANYNKLWMGRPAPGEKWVTDQALRLAGKYNWLEVAIKAGGEQSALNRYAPLWRGYGNIKPLLPDAPEELYLRYYIWPYAWDQHPDGGKWPGMDMRFADLTGSYVSALDPVVALTIPGMSRGNSGSGTDGFTGGTARGNSDRQPTAGSPLQNRRGFGTGDCYHIDQAGPYGTNVFWDRAYLAQLKKDEVSCVEIYLKMNSVTDPTQKPRRIVSITQTGGLATVTLERPETDPKYVTGAKWTIGGVGLYSGYQQNQYQGPKTITVVDSTHFRFSCDPSTPSPALPGSGPTKVVWMVCAPTEGIKDGIVRGWVNGRLACERTNIRWRHSRYRTDGGIFGIDNGWFCVFEGGGNRPTKDASLRIANLVMARRYIGPMTAAAAVDPAPAPTGATPLWLQSKPLNQWIAIAGTELSASTCTAQASAGLTDGLSRNIGYGDPRRGVLAFSGGALKRSGSEMLIFGGGGAGAWAGNDVRGLRLEDDVPVWQTRVNPSSAAVVPPLTSPSAPYMLDGVSPAARHSYWQPQFIDSLNKFMAFGCVNTWSRDTGQFYVVDGVPLATGVWEPPGTYPVVPRGRGWDGNWVCKHPLTEDVYVSGATGISRWTRATNTWSELWSTTRTDVDRATAAIDPTGNGTLLRIGAFGSANVPVAVDLATGAATVATFSGPYAAAVNVGGYYAAGLVFDPLLNKFVLFQDDGFLYTITKVSMSNWSVNRLSLTGTAPEPTHSAGPGVVAIWGRMQYVPNLKGVCIIQSHDRPAYFVQTA